MTADQDATVAFLLGPAFAGEQVLHIETHLSHVFLTSQRAYKFKKAIRLNFVDFSTPALRRQAALAELDLNRPWAGDLYVAVRPILQTTEGLKLGAPDSDGEDAIDWLVEMKRFPDGALLADLAARGALHEPHAEELAEIVYSVHSGRAPERIPFGQRFTRTVRDITENLRALDLAPAARVADWLEAKAAAEARLLDWRGRMGRVRRCHGDLHLGNICLIDGRVTPFDCIEFSADIATIDVFYDVAFAVMDLCHFSLVAHANRLLNRYLTLSLDYGGVRALPLFLALRAAVRAMTHGLRAKEGGAEATSERSIAGRYLATAVGFQTSAGPALIAIGGLSGSGKTTLARALAPTLGPAPGAVLLHADAVRKRLAGRRPEETLPADYYRAEQDRQVYAALRKLALRALKGPFVVIIDATFRNAEERASLSAWAAAHRVPFHGLWLEAPAAVLEVRIASRAKGMSDADLAVLRRQLSAPQAVREAGWRRVSVEGSEGEVRARLRAVLGA